MKLILGAALAAATLLPGQAIARHGHGGSYGYYDGGHRGGYGYRHTARKYARHYRNHHRSYSRPRVYIYRSYGYAPRYYDGYGYRSGYAYPADYGYYDQGYRGHRHSRRCDHDYYD